MIVKEKIYKFSQTQLRIKIRFVPKLIHTSICINDLTKWKFKTQFFSHLSHIIAGKNDDSFG